MSKELQSPLEAALVVVTPQVEPLVAPYRLEHDPSAAIGVPAHITINYPFLPGIHQNEELYRVLVGLFAQSEPFEFTFNKLARFPDVLYLVPEPEAPFKRLIDRVAARFPESPPYEGAFDEIIPHLTVAQSEDEEVLKSVERALHELAQKYLPITVPVSHVWLMDNRGGMWQQRASFPLGNKEIA